MYQIWRFTKKNKWIILVFFRLEASSKWMDSKYKINISKIFLRLKRQKSIFD